MPGTGENGRNSGRRWIRAWLTLPVSSILSLSFTLQQEPVIPAAEHDQKGGGIFSKLVRLWDRQQVRYLVVGTLLFLLGALITLVLAGPLGMDVRLAEGTSRIVGAIVGFVGHKLVTFRRPGTSSRMTTAAQGVSYAVVTVVNTLVAPWVLYGLHVGLELWLPAAKLISDAVMVVESYVLLSLVFARKGPRLSA